MLYLWVYARELARAEKARRMKKVLKTSALTLAVLMSVLLVLLVILMSPPVQTALSRKVLAALEENIDGRLHVGKISVRPFDAIVIEDAVLVDDHPYSSPGHPSMHPADTIAHAGYISVVFNVWGFLRGEAASLSDLVVRDGSFCLVNEPGTSNIKRVFGKKKKDKETKPGQEPPDRPFLRVGRLNIDSFRFRLMNFRNPKPDRDRAMNWTNLDIRDICLKAHDVSLTGLITEGTVDHLEARERSGYVINHGSGKARVYNMETRVENLVIRDLWSDLHLPYYRMSMEKGESSLGPFTDEVYLDAEIAPSRLNVESIAYFAPTLHKMNVVTNIKEAKVHGYVNDLTVNGFKFETPEGDLSGEVDGTITAVEDERAMRTDYDIRHLSFTSAGITRFIRGWAPGMQMDFGKYGKGERYSFSGSIRGLLDKAAISGTIRPSSGGALRTKLNFRNLITGEGKPILISGTVGSENLNLGRLSGAKSLGACSMQGVFHAGIGRDVTVKLDSLKISRLGFMGYDYKGLLAAGTFSERAFNGTVFCNDPNLGFMLGGRFSVSDKTGGGAYKFTASVTHANLHELHIDGRSTSRLSFHTDADFKTLKGGDVLGNIKFTGVTLTDPDGKHDIGTVSIDSYIKDDVNRINLNSTLATLSYSGTGFLDSFISDLAATSAGRELPALYRGDVPRWSGNTYEVTLRTLDSKELLTFIKPGLYLANGSLLKVRIGEGGVLEGRITSQRLALGERFIKDADLSFGNEGGFLSAELHAEEIKFSPLRTYVNRLIFYAEDDRLGLGFSYGDENEAPGKGELNIRGILRRDILEGLSLDADILPSGFTVSGESWKLAQTPLSLGSRGIKIGELSLSNDSGRICLSGGWSRSETDTLKIGLENFDISTVEGFTGRELGIKGTANGTAFITSPSRSGLPAILANMSISEAGFGGKELGLVKIGSMWDTSSEGYKFLCRSNLEGKRVIDLLGLYAPATDGITADLRLDGLSLGHFKPLLSSVFSEFDGSLSGALHVGGTLARPELSAPGMKLKEGLIRIGYTNVPYKVSGEIDVTSYGVFMDKLAVSDRHGASGRLSGGIKWSHLKDFYLDLGATMEGLEVTDVQETAGLPFYGNLKAGGNLRITGPFDALLLEADASTTGEGQLHIPINSSAGSSRSDLLTFKEAVSLDHIDPYEQLMASMRGRGQRESRFGTRISVKAHPGVEALIEIDKDEGNVISGRGSGFVELTVNPVDGSFSIGGDYNITDGTYHFVALGLAKRDFTIQQGSKVKFAGDVMDTDLDIDALYRIKTSLSTLLADTSATSSRRTVDCGIHISGRVKAPVISFSIDVPDIDPTTKARVESALGTEDKLQKQFLSLLISGGFLPDEQSSIVNNSSMLGTTVADMMAGQLSNILQRLKIPIDLGLDYQQNSGGADIFDVAVSTQLFNNRISVNGSIGNRQYGTTSRQEVVGDVDVEIKIDRAGTLRGSVFLHSADQYTNYLDNLQRTGVGIAYQREFNTFGDLFRSLFPFAFKKQPAGTGAAATVPKTTLIIESEEEEEDDK